MTTAKKAKGKRSIELEAKIPMDVVIAYWYDKPQDMPEEEQGHIIEMLGEGYSEGELNCLMPNGTTENRGWWNLISSHPAY